MAVDNAQEAMDALASRLDKFEAAGITVVAGGGPGFDYASACDNIIAAHSSVISVAASDSHDQGGWAGDELVGGRAGGRAGGYGCSRAVAAVTQHCAAGASSWGEGWEGEHERKGGWSAQKAGL